MTEITELIQKDEARYEAALLQIAEEIYQNKRIKLVVIAGPSCSGKTTTTKKITELIHKKGMGAYQISIDDFYRDLIDVPLEKDGKRDLEALSSIDLVSLHQVLHDLTEGKEADIPFFDFSEKKRTGVRDRIRLKDGEVALVEGLHALNPEIYEKYVAEEHIYKVYLNCYPAENRNSQSRLLRRLVRDFHFRSTDAVSTFSMWNSVRVGEKKYISPYESRANVKINTFFEYEASVLKADAIQILGAIPKESIYIEKAENILSFLSRYRIIDKSLVPPGSLLHEFIG